MAETRDQLSAAGAREKATGPVEQDLGPGTMLGRYQVARKIGEGGMAAVYEGAHVELQKRVAIKVLLPAMASNEEVRNRFLREGRAASRIHHPHVVDVTDVGAEGSTVFLVMEFLAGETLAQFLEHEGVLPVEALAGIMLPVAAAVSAAHAEGVLHRDLKPENIFLARDRDGFLHPKVLDFGISRIIDPGTNQRLTSTGAMVGTPAYMSPEQVRSTARADDYASTRLLIFSFKIQGRLFIPQTSRSQLF